MGATRLGSDSRGDRTTGIATPHDRRVRRPRRTVANRLATASRRLIVGTGIAGRLPFVLRVDDEVHQLDVIVDE